MQNKKKQIVYLVIFFVSVGAMAWIWFGSKTPTAVIPESEIITSFEGDGSSDPNTDALSKYLPFGTEFKTDLYSKPEFLQLRPTSELIISPDELGQENPFSSASSPAQGG